MMALPIFQLGSNIWTGAWVRLYPQQEQHGQFFAEIQLTLQNMFSGIVTIMLCCFGQLSVKKEQGLLLMSLVVTVVNLINLVVLEVGEWRGASTSTQKYIVPNNSARKDPQLPLLPFHPF